MSCDTISISEPSDGAVIINDIVQEAKILGANGSEFVVLTYNDDSYQTHRVSTVYYDSDRATAALKERLAQ